MALASESTTARDVRNHACIAFEVVVFVCLPELYYIL